MTDQPPPAPPPHPGRVEEPIPRHVAMRARLAADGLRASPRVVDLRQFIRARASELSDDEVGRAADLVGAELGDWLWFERGGDFVFGPPCGFDDGTGPCPHPAGHAGGMGHVALERDVEVDDEGDLGSDLEVWCTDGHGHDPGEVVRALVNWCLDYGETIPAIDPDADIVEMWQRTQDVGDAFMFHRTTDPQPDHARNPWGWKKVTVIDCERRHRGMGRCCVRECKEPADSRTPVRVAVDLRSGQFSADLATCGEHHLPEPYYRVCLIPVGATITLGDADSPTVAILPWANDAGEIWVEVLAIADGKAWVDPGGVVDADLLRYESGPPLSVRELAGHGLDPTDTDGVSIEETADDAGGPT